MLLAHTLGVSLSEKHPKLCASADVANIKVTSNSFFISPQCLAIKYPGRCYATAFLSVSAKTLILQPVAVGRALFEAGPRSMPCNLVCLWLWLKYSFALPACQPCENPVQNASSQSGHALAVTFLNFYCFAHFSQVHK